MADEANSRQRSRTWIWMVLALVVVGGFLTWLGVASEPTSVAIVEDENEGEDEMPLDSGVVAVSKDSLAEHKPAFEGLRVRVSGVEGSSPLGPRIFWGELGDRTNQIPLLVRLDSTAAEGWELEGGAHYAITGQIVRMSDSAAAAWGEQGEFSGEGEQMQATFTDYFIQASRIQRSREDAGSSDDTAQAGEGGQ